MLVTAAARDRSVLLSVVDSGLGVPADRRDALFVPYQRLGDRAPGGLGLGLAVARGFAQLRAGQPDGGVVWRGGTVSHCTRPARGTAPPAGSLTTS